MVEAKLQEHRITPYTLEVREGQREQVGPFDCEFVAVNHSIPDALAVALRSPAGLVLHTGDFKMDQLPLDGRITDLRAFARLGEEGVAWMRENRYYALWRHTIAHADELAWRR